MTAHPHILVVDDHREIRDSLARYLRQHGFRVETAPEGQAMLRTLKTGAFDLVVLDIMMPGEDGLSLCRKVREQNGPPIILLSAMAEETDRIVGLEVGADDYLVKPFNPRELLARIRAVLRRASTATQRMEKEESAQGWRFGPWRLMSGERALLDDADSRTPLSSGEFVLLRAFLNRPNMVLSRDQLLDICHGRAAQAFDRAIDNKVARLRRKMEADPANPVLIQTVWGTGYKLAAEVERL